MSGAAHNVVVLGAGITGLTAAWALSTTGHQKVLLVEKAPDVGGLASTLAINGISLDTGSHRLHADGDPNALALIKDLCGNELLRRERRGQLHLHGKVFPYPPSALDVLFGFGWADAGRFIGDYLVARVRRHAVADSEQDFESFVAGRLGRSLYERFYKPYAAKLYGMSPRTVARDAAVNRLRRFTVSGVYGDLKRRVRNCRPEYLYPAKGIGQLADALRTRFENNGGTLLFVSSIDAVHIEDDRSVESLEVTTNDGRSATLEADVVISTIPLDVLHNLVVLKSDGNGHPPFDLHWRGLRLLYLITRDRIPSDHETFYFPDPDVVFGRVSEVALYSPYLNRDSGRSTLSIEIPCTCGDELWKASDDSLAERSIADLQRAGILRTPLSDPVEYGSRKFRTVYPVYDLGWQARFDRIFRRLESIENLYVIGRTALFLHCNIDHCMAMALELIRHLRGDEDRDDWNRIRQRFFSYRVRE